MQIVIHRLSLLLCCPLADRAVAFNRAALEALNNDNEMFRDILCCFAIGWYGDNISNAVNHLHRHNKKRNKKEKRERQERYGVQLNLGPSSGSREFHDRFCSVPS